MKIAYIFSTLSKNGGTERIIIEKANYFAEQFDYDVTIINLFQRVEDTNHYLLSKKVKLKYSNYFLINYLHTREGPSRSVRVQSGHNPQRTKVCSFFFICNTFKLFFLT